MTQEEKQLLLKDLCMRFPYGVILNVDNGKYKEDMKIWSGLLDSEIWGAKPYLRSMSSITEKEKEELKEEHKKDERIYIEVLERVANGNEHARRTAVPHFAADWCNKNHFDYRGLIPMGLALEAPKGMYTV